jgi:hypothetical protein
MSVERVFAFLFSTAYYVRLNVITSKTANDHRGHREGRPSTRRRPSNGSAERFPTGCQLRARVRWPGIGVTTLAEWREKRPRLEDRLNEARELARQKALQAIKAAGEKDWRAHAEWLTFPADYRGSGNKVEVQQAVQVQISQERLEELRSKLEDTRAWLRSRDTSAVDETRKNEEERDLESRQELPDSADSDDAALHPSATSSAQLGGPANAGRRAIWWTAVTAKVERGRGSCRTHRGGGEWSQDRVPCPVGM